MDAAKRQQYLNRLELALRTPVQDLSTKLATQGAQSMTANDLVVLQATAMLLLADALNDLAPVRPS